MKRLLSIILFIAALLIVSWYAIFDPETSPYGSFCSDLDDDAYTSCINSADSRMEYARRRADKSAEWRIRHSEKFPMSLLGLTIEPSHRERAKRLTNLADLPVKRWAPLEKRIDTNPDLIGALYVVRSGMHVSMPESGFCSDPGGCDPIVSLYDLSAAAMDVGSVDINALPGDEEVKSHIDAMVSGNRLSSGQLRSLSVCDLRGKLCQGDVYLQVMPRPFLGDFEVFVIGADLNPLTYEDAYRFNFDFYTNWLTKIDREVESSR